MAEDVLKRGRGRETAEEGVEKLKTRRATAQETTEGIGCGGYKTRSKPHAVRFIQKKSYRDSR